MTALTPSENYAVASAIMDEVLEMVSKGARPEYVEREIARAQVHATLAAVQVLPTEEAIQEAVSGALTNLGVLLAPSEEAEVARAVGRLL